MLQPHWVDYVRANKDKYAIEGIKKALMQAGATAPEADEAVRLASLPPGSSLPVAAPAPAATPAAQPAQASSSAAGAAEAAQQKAKQAAEAAQQKAKEAAEAASKAAAEVAAKASAALSNALAASPKAAEAAAKAKAMFSSVFDKAKSSGLMEQAKGAGSTSGIMAQVKTIILKPRDFFREMPKNGGYLQPMVFFLAMVALSGVLGTASGLLVSLLSPAHSFPLFGFIGATIASLILAPIFATMGSGIAYAIFKALGSAESFETSARCFCYGSAVVPIVGFLGPFPFVGAAAGLGSILFWTYINIIIAGEVHAIEPAKAKKAIGGIGAALFLINAFVGYRAWQAPKKDREAMVAGMSSLARKPAKAPAAPAAAPAAQPVAAPEPPAAPEGQAAEASVEAVPEPEPAAAPAPASVTPADFKALKVLLPPVIAGGMKRVDEGINTPPPAGVTKVEANYVAPDGSKIDIAIYDSALLEPSAKAAFSKQVDNDNVTVYEKTLTFRGYPSREFFFKNKMTGKVSVLVADRYIVEARGSKVPIASLREAIGMMNYPRMESLK